MQRILHRIAESIIKPIIAAIFKPNIDPNIELQASSVPYPIAPHPATHANPASWISWIRERRNLAGFSIAALSLILGVFTANLLFADNHGIGNANSNDSIGNGRQSGEGLSISQSATAVVTAGRNIACTLTAANGEPLPPLELPPALEALRVNYSQAQCLEEAGSLEEAAEIYRANIVENDPLAPYWRWRLFGALTALEQHREAIGEMERLLKGSPGALLVENVRGLIAERFLDSEVTPVSVQAAYLDAYLNQVRAEPLDAPLLERRWEIARSAGDATRQADMTLQLWRNPLTAAHAKKWSAPPLPPAAAALSVTGEDFLVRARRLFRLRQYKRLAGEVDRAPGVSLNNKQAKALGRLYFRALIRARMLSRAAVQINTGSLMRRFSFVRRQQLIWAARIQLRRRKIGAALKYTAELESISPGDSALPQIYLELLRYNRGQRESVTMMYWLKRITAEFPGTGKASEAYWEVIWNAIRKKDYPLALHLTGQAIAMGASFHPADLGRLYYWKGRLLALMGKKNEGKESWDLLRKKFPYGYYTIMATWRQSGAVLKLDPSHAGAKPNNNPPPSIAALWKQEPFPTAIFLYAIGEYDLGTERLHKPITMKLPPEVLEEAAALFLYLGRLHLLQRLISNHHLSKLRQGPIALTPLWRRSHPLPHWDLVARLSREYGVDPFLAVSIMREESRFFTRANSRAGARGLMQLMPATARHTARKYNLPYEENLLHLPEVNIPLGMTYLKGMLKRFKQNLFHSAAAYNAGPGNVSKWLKRFGGLPMDEFVERIPFIETQNYVKRVFLSYRVYTQLYRQPQRDVSTTEP